MTRGIKKGSVRNVEPTVRQVKAINGILEGKSGRQAMIKAGYDEGVAGKPTKKLMGSKGVRVYLERLDKKAFNRFKMSLKDKVLEVGLDGLEANKLMDKLGIEYADHDTRGKFMDRFLKLFGWIEGAQQDKASRLQQFNFFAVPESEKKQFNARFQNMLKKYYQK